MAEETQILHLRRMYEALEYDGFSFVEPDSVRVLVQAMKRYPDTFDPELKELEQRLEEEEQAQNLVAHLITVRNPIVALMIVGMAQIEYRKACMEFYRGLSNDKREEILSLHVR